MAAITPSAFLSSALDSVAAITLSRKALKAEWKSDPKIKEIALANIEKSKTALQSLRSEAATIGGSEAAAGFTGHLSTLMISCDRQIEKLDTLRRRVLGEPLAAAASSEPVDLFERCDNTVTDFLGKALELFSVKDRFIAHEAAELEQEFEKIYVADLGEGGSGNSDAALKKAQAAVKERKDLLLANQPREGMDYIRRLVAKYPTEGAAVLKKMDALERTTPPAPRSNPIEKIRRDLSIQMRAIQEILEEKQLVKSLILSPNRSDMIQEMSPDRSEESCPTNAISMEDYKMRLGSHFGIVPGSSSSSSRSIVYSFPDNFIEVARTSKASTNENAVSMIEDIHSLQATINRDARGGTQWEIDGKIFGRIPVDYEAVSEKIQTQLRSKLTIEGAVTEEIVDEIHSIMCCFHQGTVAPATIYFTSMFQNLEADPNASIIVAQVAQNRVHPDDISFHYDTRNKILTISMDNKIKLMDEEHTTLAVIKTTIAVDFSKETGREYGSAYLIYRLDGDYTDSQLS